MYDSAQAYMEWERAGMTEVPAGTQACRSAVKIEMFEVQAGMQAARIVE